MREILFRGKRKDTGEWIEGHLHKMDGYGTGYTEYGIQVQYTSTSRPWSVLVLPETVGQYTGLADKNVKKIFEGDILEFSDRLVVVFWHAHLGCWDSHFLKYTNKENGKDDMSPCRWYRSKVIGNIHDNPELLKGGE